MTNFTFSTCFDHLLNKGKISADELSTLVELTYNDIRAAFEVAMVTEGVEPGTRAIILLSVDDSVVNNLF